MELVFKVKSASRRLTNRGEKTTNYGRSQIEIILGKNKIIAENTDEILYALDKLFKKSKIELESLKDIKLRIDKEAGLTSQRIVKSIAKAFCLNS